LNYLIYVIGITNTIKINNEFKNLKNMVATKNTSRFQYYNPNPNAAVDKKTGLPKRWSKGDCTIRAICAATGLKWETVFRYACQIALEECDMPNSDLVLGKVLTNLGFKKYSVKEWTIVALMVLGQSGAITTSPCIYRVRNHVVCGKGGKYFDTWDSGRMKCKTYWNLEKESDEIKRLRKVEKTTLGQIMEVHKVETKTRRRKIA
jgi:hypothetical protein